MILNIQSEQQRGESRLGKKGQSLRDLRIDQQLWMEVEEMGIGGERIEWRQGANSLS